VFVVGFLVRHHFNLRHKTGSAPKSLFPAAAVIILGMALFTAPATNPATNHDTASFPVVRRIIAERCQTCHSSTPTYAGIDEPPLGIAYDTDEDIKRYAARIHEQVVVNKAMPLGNVTNITEEERQAIDRWFAAGASISP
jgi:uncharacterized membrane protein